MKENYFKFLVVIILCFMLISGCGRSKQTSNTGDSKEFVVVTSFYPMYLPTLNIARDIPNVKIVNMTKPQTGCLHDYHMVPADLKTLESASAFVINGAGMESFMDKVTKQMTKLKIIEASKGIELINNKTNGEENPHVWVSISNAIIQAKNIGEQLAVANPENADKYKTNTDEYVEKLEREKDKMHQALDEIKNKDIVTFHEAFPYFAKEFNFNIVAIIEREPGSAPSARELADTIKTIKESKVKALFAEPQYDPKAVESIASQTGAMVYTLDPVVTGLDDPSADDYIKTMDENLKSLLKALKQ